MGRRWPRLPMKGLVASFFILLWVLTDAFAFLIWAQGNRRQDFAILGVFELSWSTDGQKVVICVETGGRWSLKIWNVASLRSVGGRPRCCNASGSADWKMPAWLPLGSAHGLQLQLSKDLVLIVLMTSLVKFAAWVVWTWLYLGCSAGFGSFKLKWSDKLPPFDAQELVDLVERNPHLAGDWSSRLMPQATAPWV